MTCAQNAEWRWDQTACQNRSPCRPQIIWLINEPFTASQASVKHSRTVRPAANTHKPNKWPLWGRQSAVTLNVIIRPFEWEKNWSNQWHGSHIMRGSFHKKYLEHMLKPEASLQASIPWKLTIKTFGCTNAPSIGQLLQFHTVAWWCVIVLFSVFLHCSSSYCLFKS